MELQQYLRVVRRYWRSAIAASLLCVVVAGTVTLTQKRPSRRPRFGSSPLRAVVLLASCPRVRRTRSDMSEHCHLNHVRREGE